jgi:hypothetical protein
MQELGNGIFKQEKPLIMNFANIIGYSLNELEPISIQTWIDRYTQMT